MKGFGDHIRQVLCWYVVGILATFIAASTIQLAVAVDGDSEGGPALISKEKSDSVRPHGSHSYSSDEIRKYIKEFSIKESDADHEDRAFTVTKHIGKDSHELRALLAITGQKVASSYANVTQTNRIIIKVMNDNFTRIEHWLNDSKVAILRLVSDFNEDIGISVVRGSEVPSACRKAVVVLKKEKNGRGFYVLTSYPAHV